MSVEIKEIEKDRTYTVNGKGVYRDIESNWFSPEELTSAERKSFIEHLQHSHSNYGTTMKVNPLRHRHLWFHTSYRKPHKYGLCMVFGTVNIGTPFEKRQRYYAFWDGEKFTDGNHDPLADPVEYWFDDSKVDDPI